MAGEFDDLLGPGETPDRNPLRELLMLACPPDPDTGQRSVLRLSRLLNVTDEAIFKWIRQRNIPPRQAARVVDLAEGRITLSMLSPFYLLDDLDKVPDA